MPTIKIIVTCRPKTERDFKICILAKNFFIQYMFGYFMSLMYIQSIMLFYVDIPISIYNFIL